MSEAAPALPAGTAAAATSLAARGPSETRNIWLQAWGRFCRHKAGVFGLTVLILEMHGRHPGARPDST